MTTRRKVLATALGTLGAPALGWAAAPVAPAASAAVDASGLKVLRLAFEIAETTFDPAKINDLYSRQVTANIFEAPYAYDQLARPAKIIPCTAAAMPEVSDDFKTWTVRLRPGIYFADDECFQGRRRELVAQDYVYSFKRFVDPANKSPVLASMLERDILGLNELYKEALASKKPFDYEREIPGMRALDRYTLQFRLGKEQPRFLEDLCIPDLLGAVAREAIEYYGERSGEHPVGTGAFRLAQWRRSSFIVLERSPGYRDEYYDAQPAPDDKEGQAILARLKGRKLPMLDRIEISIIEESQPRWLSFLNAEHDYIDRVPAELITQAMPGGKVAPNLAKRGIKPHVTLGSEGTLTFFNMEDPVVGGYTPDKVALRRAISLGYDVEREIRLVRQGQAIPAQSPIVPNTTGYDPNFKSEMSDYDPNRAKALLDLHGYVDRDGDGWREMPDGSPLVLRWSTQPTQRDRSLDELRKRDLTLLGIRVEFVSAKWPENLKAARAGKLQIWALGSSAAAPDGQGALGRLYGPQGGNQNLARFRNAEFDRIYDQMERMPDGPEREALFLKAKKIAVAYAPMKYGVHRLYTDMTHPWVVGYRRPVFWQDWYRFVDIDPSKKKR